MLRRTLIFALVIAAAGAAGAELHAQEGVPSPDPGPSRVILQTLQDTPKAESTRDFVHACGGRVTRRFRALSSLLAEVPADCLESLAKRPEVLAISADRPVRGALQQTTRAAVGAGWVVERLGVDGTGVGVAIVDSGAAAWHEDLGSRVIHFADFVNRQAQPYDDYGHGTHVAGIIAGTGGSGNPGRRGIAPGAHLVVLKALDGAGDGNVSQVVAAIDYAVRHRAAYNIRVLNLSVAAAVQESYQTDPLTQAARRAVEAGIVVITAAGNLGRDAAGEVHYGGITAPGNAPWVLTVGASNDQGTPSRRDDTVAAFSSRGPSAIDGVAKPDILAPGVAVESLGDPASLLYATRPAARRWGAARGGSEPYLTLSGTSMAAPIVAGTVALMLHANPLLTPEAVKAILQRTAENTGRYDPLTQGAGFLNARAAVEQARALAAGATTASQEDGDSQ